MGDLSQTRLVARGEFLRLRAYLEDLIETDLGANQGYRLALAVWFNSSNGGPIQNVLELFTNPIEGIVGPQQRPLLWKSGSSGPPYVHIYATSVDYFSKLMDVDPNRVATFLTEPEVLYFQKNLLSSPIVRAFNIVTEPDGLLKGWYVDVDQYAQKKTIRNLQSTYGHMKPDIGIIKVNESPDFENCKGLLHVEVNQAWLPLSPNSLRIRTFFNDLQDGKPGYFLFEGPSLYRILKFEIRKAPEYSNMVLEQLADARYAEVYLRSVHPTQ